MKKNKPRAHHKQKLRARRRQNRRHNQCIAIAEIEAYLNNFSQMTKAFTQLGQSIQNSFDAVAKSLGPVYKYLKHAYENYQFYGGEESMSYNGGSQLVRRHRSEFEQKVIHPVEHIHAFLNQVIMDLNDNHNWTREQIADWLDTLDNQPIFYPNTCPDDCRESCCYTPSSSLLYCPDNITSSKIYDAQDFTFSYEVDDSIDLVAPGSLYTTTIPTSYKGSVDIPHEWLVKLSQEEYEKFENFLYSNNVTITKNHLNNIVEVSVSGQSQAFVHSFLSQVMNFVKGGSNELPAQSCNCPIEHPGDHSYQGKYCSYHGK